MADEAVGDFVAITGSSEQVARNFLEMANGDLSQAVVIYFDAGMGDGGSAGTETTASTRQPAARTEASATASSSRSRRTRRPFGHEDQDGVIHLDSDDDGDLQQQDGDDFDDDSDVPMGEDGDDFDDGSAAAATVARTAQEEEDEAMAKRLQEEMYSETAGTQDGVRAPIGRTTEMLVEPAYGGVGGYADYPPPAGYMRPPRQPRGPANPFNQIWVDDEVPAQSSSRSSSGTRGRQTRQQRLADLFRPPYELIERLSWDEARAVGREEKRWILANIQDMSDFHCQALNRDIWKDDAIKQLVQENFIFLQYNKEDPSAESYISYYLPGGQHENPDNYPHVSIIDPRTGEAVKTWAGQPFPTALEFHAMLAEFLDRYSLDSSKKNPVQRTKAKAVVKDVGRMTEEEMLEMALQNSLATAGGGAGDGGAGSGGSGSGSGSGTARRRSIIDPDELTMLPEGGAEGEGGDKGKGKEAAEDEDAAEAVSEESRIFAQIPSDQPHVEPANNAATTTRIQFRHPTGRIIRRFAVADPVQRIYEWLKVEPLEGKEGVEFELKVVPQGHDLIRDLDKTIEEVGLKQATVMIEFLE